jgi:hypothetical protein
MGRGGGADKVVGGAIMDKGPRTDGQTDWKMSSFPPHLIDTWGVPTPGLQIYIGMCQKF